MRARHFGPIVRVGHDVDVDVPVAGVAEACNAERKAPAQAVDQIEELRDPSRWDDNIVIQLQPCDRLERRRELASKPPQLVAFDVIGGPANLRRARCGQRPFHQRGFVGDGRFPTVGLEQQHRTSALRRQWCADIRPHSFERGSVDELDRRGRDAGPEDTQHAVDRSRDIAAAPEMSQVWSNQN